MGRFEIIDKLDDFLRTQSISEEYHVVYLMVEIRKILDHNRNLNKKIEEFPLLRFYCDWTVHIDKWTSSEMKTIMEKICLSIESREELVKIKGVDSSLATSTFMYMEDLKIEMSEFFEKNDLWQGLFNEEVWVNFVQSFVKILENQPIINPSNEICSFSFLPSADRCVIMEVIFNDPINGHMRFTFSNAY
jgi:hypothetical protein